MNPPRKYLFLVLVLCVSHGIWGQLSYEPESNLRKNIRNSVWETLKPKTPENQRLLMGLLFVNDAAFSTYENIAKGKGYPPYELATVQTFFEIICEEVSRGRNFSDTETTERYRDIQTRFHRQGTGANLSNSEKQRKYDPLILKSVWLASLKDMLGDQNRDVRGLAGEMAAEYGSESERSYVEASGRKTADSNPEARKVTVFQNEPVDIEAILMRTVTNYGLGGVFVDNEVNVFYKNGEVFTNPVAPLEDFDIEASKKRQPRKWNRWQKEGGIIRVTKSKTGKTYPWKKLFEVRPAPPGFGLSGKYNASDAFTGGGVVNASTVSFDPQGRFAWKTVKGGNTDWKPIFTQERTAGTYKIDKHTLYLNYNDGRRESYFFALYPKDDEHFVIGSNHFVPVKKE